MFIYRKHVLAKPIRLSFLCKFLLFENRFPRFNTIFLFIFLPFFLVSFVVRRPILHLIKFMSHSWLNSTGNSFSLSIQISWHFTEFCVVVCNARRLYFRFFLRICTQNNGEKIWVIAKQWHSQWIPWQANAINSNQMILLGAVVAAVRVCINGGREIFCMDST